MNYSENIQIRKASTDVTSGERKYRIEYIVRNPTDKPVSSIVATTYAVTTDESGTETSSRVGNACVDIDNNRNYLAFEQHTQVPLDDQAAITAQYMADVKQILSE